LLAIAGDEQVTDKLLKGYKVGEMTYRLHLDGYNLVPFLSGQIEKSPRESFIYINDDQQVTAVRLNNWKLVFLEQRGAGNAPHLAGAVRPIARPEDVQSLDGPVRTSGHNVEYVL
jgi:hypothetical protein